MLMFDCTDKNVYKGLVLNKKQTVLVCTQILPPLMFLHFKI